MSESKGFILRLSEARAETFKTRRDANHFAEAVPEFDYSRNRVLPCFVVDAKNRITHLADASRGVRAGEQQRRLNLSGVEELKPLALSDIRSGLPTKLVNAFDKQVQRTGLVSPKVFDAMIERLTTLRPETTSILGQFSQARRRRLLALPRVASDNLALQKEAVATALSIAGISRDELTGWDYDEAVGTGNARPAFPSFIAGLPKVRLREDQMLAHDLATFPGYQALATSDVVATAFSNGTHDLTVILANRLPLEVQTGADLLYYNRTFRCILMVQMAMPGPETVGLNGRSGVPSAPKPGRHCSPRLPPPPPRKAPRTHRKTTPPTANNKSATPSFIHRSPCSNPSVITASPV